MEKEKHSRVQSFSRDGRGGGGKGCGGGGEVESFRTRKKTRCLRGIHARALIRMRMHEKQFPSVKKITILTKKNLVICIIPEFCFGPILDTSLFDLPVYQIDSNLVFM